MQIEVTGEAESLLREAMSNGGFESPSDFIIALLTQGTAQEEIPRHLELPDRLDIDTVAAEQGVKPLEDYRDLVARFCPPDESADDLLGAIGELRSASYPRAL